MPWVDDSTGLACPNTFLTGNLTRGAATPQNFWRHCVLQLPSTFDDTTREWDPIYDSYTIGGPDQPLAVMPLLLSLGVCWAAVCATLAGGIKSSGKVVMVTATAPYFFLVVLFLRGITLDGQMIGIRYYLTPQWDKLQDPHVWTAAATQIFFSLGVGYGGLISFASYNKKDEDIVQDAMILSCGNCFTSFFAGFAIFSILGNMALRKQIMEGADVDSMTETELADFMATAMAEFDVDGLKQEQIIEYMEGVVADGIGLAFVVYPQGLSELGAGWAQFFSACFFGMLFFLGIDGEFATVEVRKF